MTRDSISDIYIYICVYKYIYIKNSFELVGDVPKNISYSIYIYITNYLGDVKVSEVT